MSLRDTIIERIVYDNGLDSDPSSELPYRLDLSPHSATILVELSKRGYEHLLSADLPHLAKFNQKILILKEAFICDTRAFPVIFPAWFRGKKMRPILVTQPILKHPMFVTPPEIKAPIALIKRR
jgi:hypothetical protein